MTENDLVDKLYDNADIADDDVCTLLDRLLLRIYSVPALSINLEDVGISKDGELQLVFNQLPDDILGDVIRLIALPDVKIVRFRKDSKSYHGFSVPLKPDMFNTSKDIKRIT